MIDHDKFENYDFSDYEYPAEFSIKEPTVSLKLRKLG